MSETLLGPTEWDQFVGQERLKRRLQVHIQAAVHGKRELEHVLLAGPPGFGKTTLSTLIADSLCDRLKTLVMPMSRKALIYELAAFPGGVMFLDEIHAMTKRDQELLLPVMDRGIVVDERGREYAVGWITIVAATTERDKLIGPLHDRFTIRPDFVPYTDDELRQIVSLMAYQADVDLTGEAAVALGKAAGGIPRTARQFVFAARDLASTFGRDPTVEEILDLCETDAEGLTTIHVRYLEILSEQRGQAGQKTIEALLRVPAAYIQELERLLLQRGLIEYTPSGRKLTPEGVQKMVRREIPTFARR